VTLTAVPNFETATLECQYRFIASNGMPPREDRIELVFAASGGDTLQISHRGGQAFATADALSEYLLRPVFTGRPR
jgi:hypothetical protein